MSFKNYILVVCCLLAMQLHASISEVKIGILYGMNLTEVTVSGKKENVKFLIDSVQFHLNQESYTIKIVATHDSLKLYLHDSLIGVAKTFKIEGGNYQSTRLLHPSFKNEKIYRGSILFTGNKGFLFPINILDIEEYLPGVLEAEVGIGRPPEYYKVQAIICRTYTLSHLRRHEMEEFNLCDKEHCQVFKGFTNKSADIMQAIEKTEGVVIVDQEFSLITAAFHANCGGQTVNSEDIWNKKLSYLRSITDTFCIRQKSAVWSKEISSDKWAACMQKLCSNYSAATDSLLLNKEGSFLQFSRKRDYPLNQNCVIPLKDIRNGLGLRSTYFNAHQQNGHILLSGRGFGHGAGLCQDGAIRMSKLGYNYKSILHFYYQNVSIVHLDKIDFFRFDE